MLKNFTKKIHNRKNCLTVESHANFQGLESAVVIYWSPAVNLHSAMIAQKINAKLFYETDHFREGYLSCVKEKLVDKPEEPYSENEFLNSLTRATCRSVLVEVKLFKGYFDAVVKNIARKNLFYVLIEMNGSFYELFRQYENIYF